MFYLLYPILSSALFVEELSEKLFYELVALDLADEVPGIVVPGDIRRIAGKNVADHLIYGVIAFFIQSLIDLAEDLLRGLFFLLLRVIEKYGIFCQLWEGAEGLCHISKLALERVEKPEDVVSVGDEIIVKCIGVNEKGQIDLSRKDALKDAQKRFAKKEEE